MTSPITFANFIFKLQLLEDSLLPEYKGSMFRGAFGHAFKKAVCVTGQRDCSKCMLNSQCSYYSVFETELPKSDLPFLKGVKKLPHPMVINPPLETTRYYKKDDIINVGLTVFGSAIKFFPYFVFAFLKMGENGLAVKKSKFKIVGIINNRASEKKEIYNCTEKALNTDYLITNYEDVISPDAAGNDEIELDFLTPFRFQENGKLLANPEYLTAQHIIKSLSKRISIISTLFCGSNDFTTYFTDEKEIKISRNKLYFYQWERYSSRQDAKIQLSGFKGKVALKGNLEKIYPLLQVGQHLNIGKNTFFGLGRYKIITV